MLKKFLTVGLVRIIVVFTKKFISKVMSVSMETNPLKMKPYLCSTFSKSLKSLQYKVYPQWSFKKAISNWTSMPGCTIPSAYFDKEKARTPTQSLDNQAAQCSHMNKCILDYVCINQLKSSRLIYSRETRTRNSESI